MARQGIDYKQVSSAARSLVEEGQAPTVDNVRIRLGGTGSKSTIGPLLKRWKTENVNQAIRASSSLPVDLLESVERLYEAVEERFCNDLAAAEGAASGRVAEFEGLNVQLRDQLAQSESRIRVLSDELAATDSRLATLSAEHETEQQKRRESDLTGAALEQRLTERSSEVAHLREQIDLARQQFDHFMAATHTRWEEEQKAHEERLRSEVQTRQGLSKELQIAQTQTIATGSQLKEVTAQLKQLLVENEAMRRTLDDLRQQSARRDEQMSGLKRALDQSTATLAEVQQKYEFVLTRAAQLETNLAVSHNSRLALEARLVESNERADKLLDEKLALVTRCVELESGLRFCEQELKKFTRA